MCEKITLEKYNNIKKMTKKPSDDAIVMKKFGIGKTTAQLIRRTANFAEYQMKNKERHLGGKEAVAKLEQVCKEAVYDRPLLSARWEPKQDNKAVAVLTLAGLIMFLAGMALLVFLATKIFDMTN